MATPRPLRIAHLSSFSPSKLGTGEGRLVALASEARRRGHAMTFFGLDPVHPEVRAALSRAGANWRALSSVSKHPWSAGRRLAREFDVLQLNLIAPRAPVAIAAALARPARVLFVDRVSGPVEGDGARPLLTRLLDQVTMARVHQVAGITEYVRARAERRFRLRRGRTCVIYNGVDEHRFHPPLVARRQELLEIACVANLIPEKGVDVLLRAVAGVAEPWHLSVIGDGPERGALERLARELGIAHRTNFLGVRDDVPDLLRAAHVLVHPAVWNEALGNTILEGMASECAVIASATGGIPELIRDGQEGLLISPADEAALAAAIRRCAIDADLRSRLGGSARARVLREFTQAHYVKRHLDWIEASAQ